MESGQLSLLLGILQTLPATASGVVHRSALVGAAVGQSCVHIELQLHQASITVVTVENQVAQARDTQVLPGHGVLGLMDEIAERIGEQFVTQTRFDPQRRAETEQTLYQQIPTYSSHCHAERNQLHGGGSRGAHHRRPRPWVTHSHVRSPLLPAAPQHIALDSLLSALPGLSLPHDHTETGPEVCLPSRKRWPYPKVRCIFSVRRHVEPWSRDRIPEPKARPGAESPPNTEVKADRGQTPLPATHQLVAGCATPLSPGAHIADGAVISGPAELSVESGASVQLNGQPAEGVISLSAGDQFTAAGVEVLFIAVEP